MPFGTSGKEPSCLWRRCKRYEFDLWVRKMLWSRRCNLAQYFLPGKPHVQRSLVDYSPWGHKELVTTKHAHTTELIAHAVCLITLVKV